MRLVKAVPDVGITPAITNTYPLHSSKVYSHTHLYRASKGDLLFDLATEVEQVDPTTLTFKLRPDINFQAEVANGRQLVSSDLAYSWGRYPEALKSYGSQFNRINWGWMDASAGATFETPDDLTVTIDAVDGLEERDAVVADDVEHVEPSLPCGGRHRAVREHFHHGVALRRRDQ